MSLSTIGKSARRMRRALLAGIEIRACMAVCSRSPLLDRSRTAHPRVRVNGCRDAENLMPLQLFVERRSEPLRRRDTEPRAQEQPVRPLSELCHPGAQVITGVEARGADRPP